MDINRAVECEAERLERLCEDGKLSQAELQEELDYLYQDASDAIEEEAQQAYDEVKNQF